MATSEPVQTPNISSIPVGATLHRIRFVPDAGTDQERVQKFVDPSTYKPILALVQPEPTEKNPKPVNEYGIDILTVPSQPNDHLGANDELSEMGERSLNLLERCLPPRLRFMVRKSFGVLREQPSGPRWNGRDHFYWRLSISPTTRTNSANSNGKSARVGQRSNKMVCWPTDVPAIDPDRFEDVGQRMEQALKRRIRLAQIIPFLLHPRGTLADAGQSTDGATSRARSR